ncbi:RNA polymerase Rpc34 subunit-domain-containing protein [Melanogaster broomeanus]|nr:RNA polymerase Rpc34 subunit-domain-containing protein [Melanogaster broomeanus]
MSGRKLNADELKLHQAALAANDKLIPDGTARTSAINFLLGTGMFKVMTSAGGGQCFPKKDMGGEEAMVLGHIQTSGNEGIWTKHLKAKTELHQTVIDRCLKSLVQKQLVKSIKAVRHPTRKIYMLAHLDPSVELTGGPWYTDNELDTEFIKLLSTACLHYIRDRSFPKQSGKRSSRSQQRLYAIGAAPSHPSAQQIQHFLSKSKITETELGVDHVEMLLPPSDSDADSDPRNAHGVLRRVRARSLASRNDDERRTQMEDSDSEDQRSKTKKKKRSHKDDDSDEGSSHMPKSNKRKRKSKKSDDSDSASEEVEVEVKKKRKGKSRKREDERPHSKSKSKSKSRSSKKASSSKVVSVKRQKSPSPDLNDTSSGGAFVYRAIRQERVALGWSQAPCGKCPGPTNPQECVLRAGAQKGALQAAMKVEM